MNSQKVLIFGVLLIWVTLLSACGRPGLVQNPTVLSEQHFPTELQAMLLSSPTPSRPPVLFTPTPWRAAFGFVIEEHPLRSAPAVEPLRFEPLAGTFDQIRARHAHLREQVIWAENTFHDQAGNWGYWIDWQGQRLEIIEHIVQNPASPESPGSLEAIVRLGNQVLFTYPLGVLGPFSSIRGLWSDGESWIAEVVEAQPHTEESASAQGIAYDLRGILIRDGEILNQSLGYEEMFGFQWMGEQPFYFYRRDGKVGINYADSDILLGFDEVPHYLCCSAGELNPWQAQRMVAFFGRRDGIWYYVEARLLDDN